jgi:hypothetical protein
MLDLGGAFPVTAGNFEGRIGLRDVQDWFEHAGYRCYFYPDAIEGS